MKKLTIMYVLALIFLPLITLCMEDVKKKSHSRAKILNIFLKNQSKYLSHGTVHALAWVNKTSRKFLLDTAPERREYLRDKIDQYPDLPRSYSGVNNYGSFVCYIDGMNDGLYSKTDAALLSKMLFLVDGEIHSSYGFWKNFSEQVNVLPQPFSDFRGNVCIYGWGNSKDSQLWGKKQHLILYRLGPNNRQKFFRCGVGFLGRDKYEYYALSYFAALPNLLKAVANCSVDTGDDLFCCIGFELKNAVIPDNYAEYEDCGIASLNTRFDDLPETLRNAIIERYQECKKKRKKK